ncbi:hypothetical protein F4604DRAFT_1682422 [Suillus subluteus]|nr:hypothetical protein F4604DRAFT_1682422 [Suillus subluteus]
MTSLRDPFSPEPVAIIPLFHYQLEDVLAIQQMLFNPCAPTRSRLQYSDCLYTFCNCGQLRVKSGDMMIKIVTERYLEYTDINRPNVNSKDHLRQSLEPSPSQDSDTTGQDRLQLGYVALCITFPWFQKKAEGMEYNDYSHMLKTAGG